MGVGDAETKAPGFVGGSVMTALTSLLVVLWRGWARWEAV